MESPDHHQQQQQQQQQAEGVRIAFQSRDLQAFYTNQLPVEVHAAVSGVSKVPMALLRPDMEYVAGAATTVEARGRANAATSRWRNSGLFTSVGWSFEPLHVPAAELQRNHGRDTNVVVHFDVAEARMNKVEIGIHTSTTMVPELTATVANFMGRPLHASAVLFPAKSTVPSGELRLRSQMPIVGSAAESSFGRRIENRLTSSRPCVIADSEVVTEARSTLSFASAATDGVSSGGVWQTNVGVSLSDRALQVKEAATMAAELAEEYRSDTKLSVRLSAQRTFGLQRESFGDEGEAQPTTLGSYLNLPVAGSVVACTVEGFVAGPTAGMSEINVTSAAENCFVKSEVSLALHRKLGRFFTIDWNFFGGLIAAPFKEGARAPISDRLFLGARHVRGYRTIGPNTIDYCRERDLSTPRIYRPLGGDGACAASVSLNFPIPFTKPGALVCGHLFGNVGAVLESWRNATASGVVDAIANAHAGSVGVGIVAALPAFGYGTSGRLEANVALPLRWDYRTRRCISWTSDVAGDNASSLFQRFRFGLHWSSVANGGL